MVPQCQQSGGCTIAVRTSVEHATFELQGSQALFAQSWTPDSGLCGSIGIVHGLGEHSSRYAPLAERLGGAGFRVIAFDQRGHGQTSGRRGDAPSYEALLDDVETLLSKLSVEDLSLPKFLFGHSFGGNLVLNLAIRRRPSVSGIVATSPLLLPTHAPPRWKQLTGRFLQRILPAFRFRTGIRAEQLSHDAAVIDAHKADPLIHDCVSARLAVTMLDCGEWALEHAAELTIPTLLMHGNADAITSAEASSDFAQRAGSSCTLRTFAGLYHELHWEREREQVFNVTLNWLRQSLRV